MKKISYFYIQREESHQQNVGKRVKDKYEILSDFIHFILKLKNKENLFVMIEGQKYIVVLSMDV